MIAAWFLFTMGLASAEPLSAEAAVARALPRSSLLAEADAGVVRAQGALRAARGLRHDPELGASVALVGEAWSLEASQQLSLTGEGLADHAAARHALEAAEARRRRVELEVAAQTRRAWCEAVAAGELALLAGQAFEVSQRVLGAAEERAAVGEASKLELRIAGLRVERARTDWMEATVAEGHSLAALAGWTGLESSAIELPDDPLDGVPQPGEGSTARRADLVAAEAEVDAARAALARERAGTLPALRVGAFVEQEGAELRAGPQLSLDLPLWRANVDGRAEAAAELSLASSQQAEAERNAAAERASSARVSGILESALSASAVDLGAEARAALDSVALGYDRGELDLLSVSLLQVEIIEGLEAWLQGRCLVAEARIDALLASEDPRLLGMDGS
jgi:multidrug efflux system outer membrane protein